MEFSCFGMAVDFIVVTFDDVGEGAYTEVVCFAEEFLFVGQRKLMKGVFFKIGEPCVGVGEEEDEFYELGFVEGHRLLFSICKWSVLAHMFCLCCARPFVCPFVLTQKNEKVKTGNPPVVGQVLPPISRRQP